MEALDGNAIAGSLLEHFGTEVTAAFGSCGHCGATSRLAELVVYIRAPGSVARCRHCGNVVMVLVRVRDEVRVELTALRMIEK